MVERPGNLNEKILKELRYISSTLENIINELSDLKNVKNNHFLTDELKEWNEMKEELRGVLRKWNNFEKEVRTGLRSISSIREHVIEESSEKSENDQHHLTNKYLSRIEKLLEMAAAAAAAVATHPHHKMPFNLGSLSVAVVGWLSQLISSRALAAVIVCGLFGIAVYSIIKGLGYSFDYLFHKNEPVVLPDHPKDLAPAAAATTQVPPSWSGAKIIILSLLASAAALLVYYWKNNPIATGTPVIREEIPPIIRETPPPATVIGRGERDQSVLNNLPVSVRESFAKILKVFHGAQDSPWNDRETSDTADRLPSVPNSAVRSRVGTPSIPGTVVGGRSMEQQGDPSPSEKGGPKT